jgi:hypothetical protein
MGYTLKPVNITPQDSFVGQAAPKALPDILLQTRVFGGDKPSS